MAPEQTHRNWWLVTTGAVLAGLLALAWGGFWLVRAGWPAPAPLREFWRPFVTNGRPPLVIFSNMDLVGSVWTGLNRYDPARHKDEDRNDTYAGVGEVMAVSALSRNFSGMRQTLAVRRSSRISWEEARETNLIFLGSPATNHALKELPPLRHFVFREAPADGQSNRNVLVNVRPMAGEPAIFRTSPHRPYTEDYAVIALMTGVSHEQRVMVLAGLTTYGTEAAAQFVTSPEEVRLLLERMGAQQGRRLQPFEAMLHVKISGGIPVQSRIVAFRRSGNGNGPQ